MDLPQHPQEALTRRPIDAHSLRSSASVISADPYREAEMRRFVPFALVGLMAATPLAASTDLAEGGPVTQPEAVLPADPVQPAPELAQEAPEAPELQLDPVQARKIEVTDEAEAAQWPQRGSFWWLVGVIVVAGVLLAVLL
jgi:hypothetical protein